MYQHISLTFKVSLCFCSPTRTRVGHISKSNERIPQLLQKPEHFPSLKSEFGKAFWKSNSSHAAQIRLSRSASCFLLSSSSYNQKKKAICFCNPGDYWYSEAQLGCFSLESEKEPKQFQGRFSFLFLRAVSSGGQGERKGGKQAQNLERTKNLKQCKAILSLSSKSAFVKIPNPCLNWYVLARPPTESLNQCLQAAYLL